MTSSGASIPSGERTTDGRDVPDRAQRKASILTAVGLALAFAGALALWLWSRADESSAIREIPATERAVLYESTHRALSAACVSPRRRAGLEDYCNAQARFILHFEECDAACQELARQATRLPRR